MADRRKLAQGLMMMTPSARADIAQQADEFERFKQADYLRKMGEQGAGLAKSVARGVPQMATGLIDLASMPFEAAGVLQPGQAVGSTKWLENRGYLPESQPGFANQLTELLSGGFDPSDLITKGAPMLAALRTTWHGSPHGFTKFDMSKIGTGEGAQAYGHGLYLAEARPVAEEYASNLSKDVFNVGGELFNPADIKHLNVRTLARKGDIDSAIKKATELAASDSPVADLAKLDLDLLQQAKAKGGFQEATGYLYKVDLPDEQIAKMLDYDLPLANQPEQVKQSLLQLNDPHINEALSTSPVYNEAGDYWSYMGNTYGSKNEALKDVTPAQLISGQRGSFKSPQEASQRFYEAGIPGIQYLDQASRGTNATVIDSRLQGLLEKHEGNAVEAVNEFMRSVYNTPKKKEAMREFFLRQLETPKTRNYVVFSDEIPQILERNGQPIAQALRNYETPKQTTLQDVVAPIEQRGVTLDVYESNKKPLMTLSRIEVPKEMRGQGVGTQAMQDLVNYANQQGKTIALSPSTDFGGTSVNRLKDFYKQFGFVENKGRNKDFEISESMYRLPETE